VDAALARTNLALCSREVHWIGYPQGWRTIEPADIGTIVQKTGRSTGHTIGRIIAIDATIDVSYSPSMTARFQQQIITTAISQPGDSGSLVLDRKNQIIGLLFAGSEEATVINPINLVKDLLKIELI